MNRAERRAQERKTSGYYWRSAIDWEQDKKDIFERARKIAVNSINVVWAGFLIAGKRECGLNADDLERMQNAVKQIMNGVESATELREICFDECGVDCMELVNNLENIEEA